MTEPKPRRSSVLVLLLASAVFAFLFVLPILLGVLLGIFFSSPSKPRTVEIVRVTVSSVPELPASLGSAAPESGAASGQFDGGRHAGQ